MTLFSLKLPKILRDAVSDCRHHFLSAAGFSALVNILFLAPTLYMMQVYDRVVPTGGVLTLLLLTAILAVTLGTLSLLDNVRSRLMIRASTQLNISLSARIFERLVSQKSRGNTGQAMRDFDAVRQTMTGPATMALFDVPWTPIYLLAAFVLHPILALLVVVGGAILIALAVVNERTMREGSKEGQKAMANAYATQDTLLSKAEIIRALGMRRAMVSRQQTARSEGIITAARTQLSATRYNALVKFVRMFLQSLALGVAAWLAINGQISSGSIIAASVLLSRALQPIEQLVGGWPAILQARQSLKALSDLFEGSDEEAPRNIQLPNPAGYLEFDSVALRNPQHTAFILRGVSFKLTPGEITGLIGASGSGKSTTARIAAHAISPDTGEVRIDGANFADWDPEQLAKHIGYLPQDNGLLPGTIQENIARFAGGENENDIDEKVVSAAKLVGIHEMILRMPDGYNARIGSPGFALSGGQTQRIALARAVYGDPKILILDEPSSALDAEGEQALMRTLEAVRLRGMAVLLIAHRSQVLNMVDNLIVMNEGVIIQQGLREEIVEIMREAARENIVNINRG